MNLEEAILCWIKKKRRTIKTNLLNWKMKQYNHRKMALFS